jgi:hypothetical protein
MTRSGLNNASRRCPNLITTETSSDSVSETQLSSPEFPGKL